MKAMMGFFFFVLFLAGLALVMLQGRQMAAQNMAGGGAAMTGVTWRPVLIGAEKIADDSAIYVSFEIDGSIKGHAGCNSFFGTLEQTTDGVVVGALGSTRMACPEPVMNLEGRFMDALQKGKAFEMGSDRLQILDEDKVLLMELVPV